MIEKKDLLQAVQALLDVEEEMLLSANGRSAASRFFPVFPCEPPRRSRRAGSILCPVAQHRKALQNLMDGILSGGQDVY